MIPRQLAVGLLGVLQQYPVATVVGPRQAGKTTLVRSSLPEFAYVNLEEPESRQLAMLDPKGFLQRYPRPLIIDEVQRVPSLLSSIQVEVDKVGEKGRYVLTGSHQTALQQAISQSLAGRTAVLRLLPLSLEELGEHAPADADTLMFRGFLPRVYDDNQDPTLAYRSYYQTYVERDLRQLANIRDLASFERFMRLAAGRIGQLFNASALAGEVGVSHKTIEHWTSALEASFLVLRLQPYFENFNKRFVKTPKLYFTEPGLATYLLGIESTAQLSRDPLRGSLFENLVIMELVKARMHRAKEPSLYFVRDQKGTEIDALFAKGRNLLPIEIKSSTTFHPSMTKSLNKFRKWAGERVDASAVIYGGEAEQQVGEHRLLGYRNASTLVND